MTDTKPTPAPLPATGGSWIRDSDGRLYPADAAPKARKPRPDKSPSPVKEG